MLFCHPERNVEEWKDLALVGHSKVEQDPLAAQDDSDINNSAGFEKAATLLPEERCSHY